MQDPPSKEQLLAAVGRLLQDDLLPVVEDPALGFKIRIAANLIRVVAAECALERDHDLAELTRLRALFPGTDVDDRDPREAIGALNRLLAQRIRDEGSSAAVSEHVLATLREKLDVVSPRFVTDFEIEG